MRPVRAFRTVRLTPKVRAKLLASARNQNHYDERTANFGLGLPEKADRPAIVNRQVRRSAAIF